MDDEHLMPDISAVSGGAALPQEAAARQVPIFEGYELLGELPRGGQAIVYKAVQQATGAIVAIKVLLPHLLASERARYYFEKEVRLIGQLDHPRIIRVRDSGVHRGQFYFITDYIDGATLEQYLQQQPLTFREKVELFRQVCHAVVHAHQRGVMHRDLKMTNIMVDKHGQVCLLDFGLAKACDQLAQSDDRAALATMTGQWAGSPATMSPEQAAGTPQLIDFRSDIYSLGVVLYYMVTGRYPYDVSGPLPTVLGNVQHAPPRRPRTLWRKFDADMEAILLKALAKDRAQRYQAAAELLADMDNWLAGLPVRARPVTTWYLLKKIIRRHRYSSMVAACLVVILISFAVVSFQLYWRARQAQVASDRIAAQWSRQAQDNLALARQMAFTFFLEAFHGQRDGQAARIAAFLSRGSKERAAAAFLLHSKAELSAEALQQFRARIPGDYDWFAAFTVGEYHLKNRRYEQALLAYRQSYEALESLQTPGAEQVEPWLLTHLAGRLDQLDKRGPQSD